MHQEIKSTLLWIVLATVVGLAGIWQVKVAIGQGLQPAHEKLPPPLKTRAAVRPPVVDFSGNVVEDYIARCTKGLTDREIGWIVADFRNTGLDLPPAAEASDGALIAYHKLQNRWYRDILTDGLRLSASQSAEVDRTLAELLREVSEARYRGPSEGITKNRTLDEIGLLFRLWFFTSQKESDEATGISLSGLITATAQQQDILNHSFFTGRFEFDPFDPASTSTPASLAAKTPPIDPSRPTLKGKTAATYPIEEDYPIPTGFEEADQTFPILKSQQMVGVDKEGPSVSDPFIHNVRRLHSAQLKALLLYNPEAAARIQSSLDNARD